MLPQVQLYAMKAILRLSLGLCIIAFLVSVADL